MQGEWCYTGIAMFLESFLASITFSIETISPNRREPIFLAEDGGGVEYSVN